MREPPPVHGVTKNGKRGFMAVGVVLVLIAGWWWWMDTHWKGEFITKCSYDAQGPYAVVVDHAIGGASNDGVNVRFGYRGRTFDPDAFSRVHVGQPIGSGTVVVHGVWPPPVIGRHDPIRVYGRMVYRSGTFVANRVHPGEYLRGRLVTPAQYERQIRLHPHGPFEDAQPEIIPVDPQNVVCVLPPGAGEPLED
jgi:hypothetical protein